MDDLDDPRMPSYCALKQARARLKIETPGPCGETTCAVQAFVLLVIGDVSALRASVEPGACRQVHVTKRSLSNHRKQHGEHIHIPVLCLKQPYKAHTRPEACALVLLRHCANCAASAFTASSSIVCWLAVYDHECDERCANGACSLLQFGKVSMNL